MLFKLCRGTAIEQMGISIDNASGVSVILAKHVIVALAFVSVNIK